jgi:hypothetical protein
MDSNYLHHRSGGDVNNAILAAMLQPIPAVFSVLLRLILTALYAPLAAHPATAAA